MCVVHELLCASVVFLLLVHCFAHLPVVDVRLYKGGAAEIFRFDLLIDLWSDPSVSKVVQLLGGLFHSSSVMENSTQSF